MTARFHFIGAMTLALVLGGCASREPALGPPSELLKLDLATTGGGTSPETGGSTPGTAATGSAIPESVSQGPLPIAPQTLRSTTGVTQNQQMLDRPQDQPSSIQTDPGSTEPSDRPDKDTGSGQLSYPAAMERQLAKTNE